MRTDRHALPTDHGPDGVATEQPEQTVGRKFRMVIS